jgi:hypothetical protein
MQGREKDIVIFSCVRTAGVHRKSIGFVADERRINVGITRARCALLIIGHAASLATDERWRNLVRSAVERGCMYQPTKPYSAYMKQVRARHPSCVWGSWFTSTVQVFGAGNGMHGGTFTVSMHVRPSRCLQECMHNAVAARLQPMSDL